MKKTPYSEIIDVVKEQKEYSLLCQGKSKKFVRYTEWEDYIGALLCEFPTEKDMYNFKRYCRNKERTSVRAPESIGAYITLLIPLLVDKMFVAVPGWMVLAWFFVVVMGVIIKNNVIVRESYFYTDIIEVIEKMETTADNTSKRNVS